MSTELAERVFLSVLVGNALAQDTLISLSQSKANLEFNCILNLNSTTLHI
ncbi:Hypothetical protein Cul210932_0059 [Corynebacterium ulcerans]|nr:Hypothetical protein Cul210932_0059 [Corynebacterium ulcerans]